MGLEGCAYISAVEDEPVVSIMDYLCREIAGEKTMAFAPGKGMRVMLSTITVFIVCCAETADGIRESAAHKESSIIYMCANRRLFWLICLLFSIFRLIKFLLV